MLKVTFSNGEEIICTKYHKFHIINSDNFRTNKKNVFH